MVVLGIIQARMGSSRLPGKVLKTLIDKKTTIELMIERLKKSEELSKLVIATSTNKNNDDLSLFCLQKGIDVFRGSEEDVLDRFYQLAKHEKADIIVRLTGDCPLHDASIVDFAIRKFKELNIDYLSNINPPTFPDGLDVEVISFIALEKTWELTSKKIHREHVTPFIRENQQVFKTYNFINEIDYSAYRWTLDEEKDLKFLREIYKQLYPQDRVFSWVEVINLIKEKPNLLNYNNDINRNEGYFEQAKNEE